MYSVENMELGEWSKQYTGAKFHAVLCDPPYGLKFMGKDWDVVSAKEWGEALLPHLHPGALCLMFGGTRTWHKLATGMEEAGFEIWDTLMWLHGQGFPKGQDISKLIDKKNEVSTAWTGHKTCALKPAWEPILALRVPTKQTYADLALNYGSGCLNIDAARIGPPVPPTGSGASHTYGWANYEKKTEWAGSEGRYPANLLLECICGQTQVTEVPASGSVTGEETSDPTKNCYGDYKRVPFRAYPGIATLHTNPDCPAALLDAQSGQSTTKRIEKPSDCGGNTWGGTIQTNRGARGHSDSGGASRFFYCAKASTSERNAGCETLPTKAFGMSNQAKAEVARGTEMFENSGLGVNSVKMVKNNHPTVKPVTLTEYLAKLLLPPYTVAPRRLLVPFAGSGSEMIGAVKAGWDEIVGVEKDPDYCEIAKHRLIHWSK